MKQFLSSVKKVTQEKKDYYLAGEWFKTIKSHYSMKLKYTFCAFNFKVFPILFEKHQDARTNTSIKRTQILFDKWFIFLSIFRW